MLSPLDEGSAGGWVGSYQLERFLMDGNAFCQIGGTLPSTSDEKTICRKPKKRPKAVASLALPAATSAPSSSRAIAWVSARARIKAYLARAQAHPHTHTAADGRTRRHGTVQCRRVRPTDLEVGRHDDETLDAVLHVGQRAPDRLQQRVVPLDFLEDACCNVLRCAATACRVANVS